MNRLVEKSPNNAPRIKIGESTATAMTATGSNGNIILLRGAQSDGGHIILQNGQELLQLLNGEAKSGPPTTPTSGKTIILQGPRVKQPPTATEASKNVKNRITLHQTAGDHPLLNKATVLAESAPNLSPHGGGGSQALSDGGETILVQTNGLSGKRISATTLSDGSILLHPRMMDSFTTQTTTGTATSQSAAPSTDGPILLQTLKRFDKSFLVVRNSSATVPGKAAVGGVPAKMETCGGSTVSLVEDNEPEPLPPTVVVSSPKKGLSSGGRSAANGAKANVFNKAINVIAGNVSGGGSSTSGSRGNGISTRSSSANQKPQRGSNRSDSNKKDAGAAKQSNIPIGSGK